MPTRRIPLISGEYYHLYNRGNNHENIFLTRENYSYFLTLWRKYLFGHGVDVVSYCLMPNHYHFLIYLQTDTLSKLMQPFLLAYTNSFNRRYKRVGALFQGRFKAKHVANIDYLLHLSRYIHLNPLKAGLVLSSEEWEFSSYLEYTGLRQGTLPKPNIVMDYFENPNDYKDFVEDGNDFPDDLEHLLFD